MLDRRSRTRPRSPGDRRWQVHAARRSSGSTSARRASSGLGAGSTLELPLPGGLPGKRLRPASCAGVAGRASRRGRPGPVLGVVDDALTSGRRRRGRRVPDRSATAPGRGGPAGPGPRYVAAASARTCAGTRGRDVRTGRLGRSRVAAVAGRRRDRRRRGGWPGQCAARAGRARSSPPPAGRRTAELVAGPERRSSVDYVADGRGARSRAAAPEGLDWPSSQPRPTNRSTWRPARLRALNGRATPRVPDADAAPGRRCGQSSTPGSS